MGRSRVCLLSAGVSLMALGISAPAVAQSSVTPGVQQDGPHNVNRVETAENESYGSHVIDINVGGAALALAGVSCGDGCAQPGAVSQRAINPAGQAINEIIVEGTLAIEAIADAQGDSATALASMRLGIEQFASGTEAANGIDVSGSVRVLVSAAADADAGSAIASASASQPIAQRAIADEQASNAIDNSGTIDIVVTADALSRAPGGSASATVTLWPAIFQHAESGDDASNALTNSGTIELAAIAAAEAGGGADASAWIATGVNQFAIARGTPEAVASNQIANTGTIAINADAAALSSGPASAQALIGNGINQMAVGRSGASASLVNGPGADPLAESGLIEISASASAAGTNAFALAIANFGLMQAATATSGAYGTAAVDLANSGAVRIDASAVALGSTATAISYVERGIAQIARASGVEGGVASVAVDNSGLVSIGLGANAQGSSAFAAALMNTAVYQDAHGADAASVTFTNSGVIGVTLQADARGASYAEANSILGVGILQSSIATADDGVASLALTNGDVGASDGPASLVFSVNAIASATAGDAFAAAVLGGSFGATGIGQFASGNDAAASIANSGTMALAADAVAVAFGTAGSTGTGVIPFLGSGATGTAMATAAVGFAISQVAFGGEDATVSLRNSGSVDIVANAFASGNAGGLARASVVSGVYQTAGASTTTTEGAILGKASAEVVNSGSIDISANASAISVQGPALAVALLGQGVFQGAAGGEQASVSLENSGQIQITAGADALGMSATAAAYVFNGIDQVAAATGAAVASATASLANSGDFTISADADATGINANSPFGLSSAAYAEAFIEGGIQQFALGRGSQGGSGVVKLDNSGSLAISAAADAHAASASAIAIVGLGVSQAAFGYDLASVTLTNSGTLSIAADAAAQGTAFAAATAVIQDGIRQSASVYEPGSTGSVTLENGGLLSIGAGASAVGSEGSAVAFAGIDRGILQSAAGDVLAEAALVNLGTLSIAAEADALAADTALAFATLLNGIHQSAAGLGVDAAATVELENSGALILAVDAAAAGGDTAVAIGFLGTGISQLAFGGASGTAAVGLTNSGSLDVTAGAQALAGDFGLAQALIGTAVFQFASAASGASVTIANSGDIVVAADAHAVAANVAHMGADATAAASAEGFVQIANARLSESSFQTTPDGGFTALYDNSPSGPASAVLSNSGSIIVSANASGHAGDEMIARADLLGAMQRASGSEAVAEIANDGTMNFAAAASATGETRAVAAVFNAAINQVATAIQTFFATTQTPDGIRFGFGNVPIGAASASLSNSGVIEVSSNANALATGSSGGGGNPGEGDGWAGAGSYLGGAIRQSASASIASVDFDNSGTFAANAAAVAEGEDTAIATALAEGIFQNAVASGVSASTVFGPSGTYLGGTSNFFMTGSAVASVHNSGVLQINADASAFADGFVRADAWATGVIQGARGQTAAAAFDNSGTYDVVADAIASGTSARALGLAIGLVQRDVTASADASNSFTNSGAITINAVADAVGTAAGTGIAIAVGASQEAFGDLSASLSFENSGAVSVAASANADGGFFGGGTALAIGVQQRGWSEEVAASFVNSGDVAVSAIVDVSAADQDGFVGGTALADGYLAVASSVDVIVQNDGTFAINADAAAAGDTGWAWASAEGISLSAVGHFDGTTMVDGALSGSILNSGDIIVGAQAAAAPGPSGEPKTTATAVGISLSGGSLNFEIVNSGLIVVTAVTAPGGAASAQAIVAADNGTGGTSAGDLLTITNNGGTILAAISTNNGATFQRGMAIDVAAAPNNSVINLLGDGAIYGDIDVQDGDEINVNVGSTYFDGIINPECAPPAFDDPAVSACGQGTLNIFNTGNLILADPRITGDLDMYDGPAHVFVNEFNVAADGTITFELQPATGGTQPIGTYPQVLADVANLDGTLVADIATTNILPQNAWFWNNVIDANTRDGTFDQCLINFNGADVSNSIFVDFGCVYDAQANVDLAFERIAFNEIAGLTRNQQTVADAIENVFDPNLTGTFGNLLAEMFLFDTEAEFADALDQLSGVEYPNFLHAVRNNTFVLNGSVSDKLDCAIHIGGIDNCRAPEYGERVWVMGTYNDGELDSNTNRIGYEASNWSAMIGADWLLGNFSVGAFAGYRDIGVDFPDARIGSSIEADGWQLGLTAAYDVGSFYARGILSHSWLGGNSERRFAIGGLSGVATGDPDVNVWSIYGEAGGRFDLGGSWLTPHVAVDQTSMRLKDFRETGGIGGNLDFDSQTESQTSGLAGLKWAGNFGGIVPEAKVAYRYDFTRDLGVDMRFADAPVGSDFRRFEEYKRGSLIAGLSLAGAFGSNLTGRLGYQGRFNSEISDHAISGALTFRFGGAAPPPPPLPPSAPERR